MADVRDLTVRINGDASGYSKAVDQVSVSSSKAEKSVANFTKAFVFGNVIFSLGTDIAIRFKDALGEASKEAQSMQASNAQFAASLKSTNDASGQSVESLNKLAESIAKTTPISKGAAMQAEQMLLPFTNIGKQVFPGVIKAADDLATHMNHGLAPSSDQVAQSAKILGLAFDNPSAAFGRLKKAGVDLTDAQKTQIKTMQASGDMVGAQKILLDDLSKAMGGSAIAAGTTFSGQLTKLKNNLVDVAANGIIKLEEKLNDLAKWWSVHEQAIKRVANQVLQFLTPSFEALWNTITNKVLPAFQNFWKNIIEPLLPVIGVLLVAAIWGVTNGLNLLLAAITPVMNFISDHRQFVELLTGAFLLLKASMILGDAFDALKIGFATLQLVTIPGAISSLSAFTAAWVAAFPVAGILVDLGLVLKALQTIKGAYDAVKDANAQIASNNASNQAEVPGLEAMAVAGKTAQQRTSAKNTLHMLGVAGYATGGFTGNGSSNDIAGVVHKGEYVIPKGGVDQNTGLPKGGGVNITMNVGMYAGMPVEKRQIALDLYKELVRAARSQGVSLPMIGAVGVQ